MIDPKALPGPEVVGGLEANKLLSAPQLTFATRALVVEMRLSLDDGGDIGELGKDVRICGQAGWEDACVKRLGRRGRWVISDDGGAQYGRSE